MSRITRLLKSRTPPKKHSNAWHQRRTWYVFDYADYTYKTFKTWGGMTGAAVYPTRVVLKLVSHKPTRGIIHD